jgi:putative hydrolase of the HAD superfamily
MTDVYRVISNLLSYQGISLATNVVKDLYFQIIKNQRAASDERYPEFDTIAIFREIVTRHSTDFTRGLPAEKIAQLQRLLAETYRAASRFQLQLYPGVEDTIRQLRPKYHLAIISDGQTAYAVPELNAVGLSDFLTRS